MLHFNQFKANELRTILFYTGIAFSEFIEERVFKHFIVYMLAMRLLTQDRVERSDATDAFKLLNYFHSRFLEVKTGQSPGTPIYQQTDMTYKLHAHLHLPAQVLRFGPLHKVSCFLFEGN